MAELEADLAKTESSIGESSAIDAAGRAVAA